jgi:hypothetical protein
MRCKIFPENFKEVSGFMAVVTVKNLNFNKLKQASAVPVQRRNGSSALQAQGMLLLLQAQAPAKTFHTRSPKH